MSVTPDLVSLRLESSRRLKQQQREGLEAVLAALFEDDRRFAEWVGERVMDVVGEPSNAGTCPVARFLADVVGAQVGHAVQASAYRRLIVEARGRTLASIASPPWVVRFIHALDEDAHQRGAQEVKGYEALVIAARVGREPR